MSSNLFYIGPVVADVQDPAIAWGSSNRGQRTIDLAGVVERKPAEQLSELMANDDVRITAADTYGVALPVYIDHVLGQAFVGWYIFPAANEHNVDVVGELGELFPFKLKGVFLGHHPEIVIDRTSVPRGNDFGLVAKSLVVSPVRPADDAGDRFIVDPGGTFRVRPYDPNAYDPAVQTPTETAAIGFYEGVVTDTSDDLASICLPRLAWSKSVPKWLAQQGGSVRARDRRADRDVFGPHPILETTDLMVNNGLIRAWVGNRGVRPFLNVQIFDGTSWREPGTIQFGGAGFELVDAQLKRVTFDDAVLSLRAAGVGDILVTLKRGERILRITQPEGMVAPVWSGIPPATRAVRAAVTPAHFGKGLVGGFDLEDASWESPFDTWAGDDFRAWDGSPYQPDLRLRWPADVVPTTFACVWRYSPVRDRADLGTVGLRTLYSEGGIPEVEVYVDGADAKAKVRVSDTVVIQSAALDFDVGDDILIGLSYDGTTLTLSWKADDGTVTHTAAAASIAAGAFYDDTYFVNFGRWGDGTWGDGVWGGDTYFPGGAIDNDMILEDAISTTEFAALATATTPLGGLPAPEGRLRRYVPFDARPLVSMPGIGANGRSVDPVVDDHGFTKVIAALSAGLEDLAAYVASAVPGDTVAEQHAQAAADNTQRIRVR